MSTASELNLVAGVLALDFVNTASGRDTPTPHDHLNDGHDFLAWARHAAYLPEDAAHTAGASLEEDGLETLFGRAIGLREAVYAVGAALARHEAPPEPNLDTIRDEAARAIAGGKLRPSPEGGYGFDFSEAEPSAALLGPLALSAMDFLEHADLGRVKQCPGHGPGHECQWLFLDTSKNRSRRWCDMATCGNRSKSKRHRDRRGGQTTA